MEPEDGMEDDAVAPDPASSWVHPDDRLWRHPSEVGGGVGFPAGTLGGIATTPDDAHEDAPANGGGGGRILWMTALLGGLIGSLLTAGVATVLGYGRPAGTPAVERQVVEPVAARLQGPSAPDIVAIAKMVGPAVVQILAGGGTGTELLGTGLILTSDGKVLTTSRVVGAHKTFSITLSNGRSAPARLIGTDNETDLAMIAVDGPDSLAGIKPLPTVALGSGGELDLGEAAVVVGCPKATGGQPWVGNGIIAATGRKVMPDDGGPALSELIQTSVPGVDGNGGAALLDGGGALIGITTSVRTDDGSGPVLAIPVDVARDVVDQMLENNGKVVHPYLGIDGAELSMAQSDAMRVPGGILVRRVTAGSPAEKGGLRVDDVMTTVAGDPVTSMDTLRKALRGHRPGDQIDIVVRRGDGTQTLSVTLAKRP